MSQLFTLPFQTPFQSSAPIGLARLYFFAAGTTTHQPVYTTAELTTAHDQPVRSSADGAFPPIFLNPNASADYRIQLKTADDVLVTGGDVDNIPRRELSQIDFNAYLSLSDPYKRTAAEIAAGVTPVNYAYPPGHVERYQAWTNSSTDMAVGLQAAFNVCASHIATAEPNRTYRCNSNLVFPAAHGLQVDFSGAIIDSYSSGAAIGFTPISNIYPQNCLIKNLYVYVNGGSSRTGILLRTSYSKYYNVQIFMRSNASSAKGWTLNGDADYGTGPYYNHFYGCDVGGSHSSQVGWYLLSNGTRGPNANYWWGGRHFVTGGVAFRIAGNGNNFYGLTVEGGTITAFDFISPVASACTQNNVFGCYVESVTNAFVFAADTVGNGIYGCYLTGITNTWTDSGTGNYLIEGSAEWKIPQGLTFSSTSSDANALDYYAEGSITPALSFATPGTLSVAYGTSNSGSYTRIGNRVFYDIDLDVSSLTLGTASGALKITGLPFAAASGDDKAGTISNHSSGVTYSGGRSFITPIVVGGTSTIQFYQNGSGVAATDLLVGNITGGGALRMQLSGSYNV